MEKETTNLSKVDAQQLQKNLQSVADLSAICQEGDCLPTEVTTAVPEQVNGTLSDVAEVSLQNENASTEETSDQVAKKSHSIKFFSAGNLTVMSILTAISFVLYAFVKFPLPFLFPSFLDIQISDLPAMLGGFALGPIAGCIIIVVKCCIKMAMTTTACVGELADIIVGIAFVLPASLIYKFHKNRKGALIGMLVGMVFAVSASLLANWLVLIPFYTQAYGMKAVVGMMSALYPDVTEQTVYNYYLPLAVLPFNVLRCTLSGVLTYFTYKPLSKALHWEIKKKAKVQEGDSESLLVEEALPELPAEGVAEEEVPLSVEGVAEESAEATGSSYMSSILKYQLLQKYLRRCIIHSMITEKTTTSTEDTEQFAEQFAKTLSGGDVVVLQGDLAAGKTHFVKGLARGLGVADTVTSPTFALHNAYEGSKFTLNHFDFYRVQDEEEVALLGLDEMFYDKTGICAIEWAENIRGLLPPKYIVVVLEKLSDDQRHIVVLKVGEK